MICPNCGNEVYFEDMVDTEYYDTENINVGYGTCDKCHKIWSWCEVFTYSKDIEIQELLLPNNDHS